MDTVYLLSSSNSVTNENNRIIFYSNELKIKMFDNIKTIITDNSVEINTWIEQNLNIESKNKTVYTLKKDMIIVKFNNKNNGEKNIFIINYDIFKTIPYFVFLLENNISKEYNLELNNDIYLDTITSLYNYINNYESTNFLALPAPNPVQDFNDGTDIDHIVNKYPLPMLMDVTDIKFSFNLYIYFVCNIDGHCRHNLYMSREDSRKMFYYDCSEKILNNKEHGHKNCETYFLCDFIFSINNGHLKKIFVLHEHNFLESNQTIGDNITGNVMSVINLENKFGCIIFDNDLCESDVSQKKDIILFDNSSGSLVTKQFEVGLSKLTFPYGMICQYRDKIRKFCHKKL